MKADRPPRQHLIATVGYESATVQSVLEALKGQDVTLLVDVRAVTSSRRPGFSKSQLAAHLEGVGIAYVHLRGLGTPAEGRAAARVGNHDRLREIYTDHLDTVAAGADLAELAARVRAGERVCLLCYEADPSHCHRSMVVDALNDLVPVRAVHLRPG